MFALLLGAGLLVPVAASPYTDDSLHAFAAVANDRVIDGIAYADGDGVLSAGLLYAHPRGAFAASELAAFTGSGSSLPAEAFMTLESALGWRAKPGKRQDISLGLLDYRLRGENTQAHQGLMLAYAYGDFTLELARRFDKPYYYRAFDAFVPYDVTSTSLNWTRRLPGSVEFQLGLARQHLSRSDRNYFTTTASLQGNWRRLEWQVLLVHVDEPPFGGTDPANWQTVLRLAWPFTIL